MYKLRINLILIHIKVEARRRANKKYNDRFVEIKVRVTPEKRSVIKDHAESMGESATAFINRAIDEAMERARHCLLQLKSLFFLWPKCGLNCIFHSSARLSKWRIPSVYKVPGDFMASGVTALADVAPANKQYSYHFYLPFKKLA